MKLRRGKEKLPFATTRKQGKTLTTRIVISPFGRKKFDKTTKKELSFAWQRKGEFFVCELSTKRESCGEKCGFSV